MAKDFKLEPLYKEFSAGERPGVRKQGRKEISPKEKTTTEPNTQTIEQSKEELDRLLALSQQVSTVNQVNQREDPRQVIRAFRKIEREMSLRFVRWRKNIGLEHQEDRARYGRSILTRPDRMYEYFTRLSKGVMIDDAHMKQVNVTAIGPIDVLAEMGYAQPYRVYKRIVDASKDSEHPLQEAALFFLSEEQKILGPARRWLKEMRLQIAAGQVEAGRDQVRALEEQIRTMCPEDQEATRPPRNDAGDTKIDINVTGGPQTHIAVTGEDLAEQLNKLPSAMGAENFKAFQNNKVQALIERRANEGVVIDVLPEKEEE